MVQFQWFLGIMYCLKFIMGEIVYSEKLQDSEINNVKVQQQS